MLTRFVASIAVILLSACMSSAQKHTATSRADEFNSPDGMLVAVIHSTKAPEATIESRIELRTRAGRVLAKRDYTSEDGEHGYGVTKAAWTPNSQFFVYSLESSGGHSAWHSPVHFFSRRDSKVSSLDDALHDAVTNPQFSVSAPDGVTVELEFSKQTKTISLHSLKTP